MLRALRTATLALLAFGSLTVANVAEAASCRAMKAELASMGSGKGARARRYRKAVARQSGQMKRVKALLADHGCGSRRSSTCLTLTRSHQAMKRNLRGLERELERATGGKRRVRLRRRIAKRCNEFPAKKTRKASRRANRETKATRRRRTKRSVARRSGTFATMCVRMCDGFAFPVSLSTTPKRFGADAKACQSQCPGTSTRLYAAPARAAEIENARDVETGELYGELSTAFRHRKVFDRACACRVAPRGLDYGRPIAAKPKLDTRLRPARDVRVVGSDYFSR